MNTWIFQGNPKSFNVDDYLLENERIWWSIRQQHLAKHIQLNDEVFIWRSDGAIRGSGGVVARAQIISLPQEYTNDDDSLEYWYEDVSGDTYLAVELKVLEEAVADGINRTELMEHEHLSDMMILRLKQNTNYLLSEHHSDYLRQMWYSRIPVNPSEIYTRFPFVDTIEDVIENMERFEADRVEVEKLEKQLPTFQQWYYIHELNLLAPSKFIGYKKMKGHLYVDKDAIAWTDGRATVGILDKWFIKWESLYLKDKVISKLNGRTRKSFTVNILKSEKNLIEELFPLIKNKSNERQSLPKLRHSKRVREYKLYSDELKAQILFEHLIHGEMHRWLDINVLGIKDGKSNGRNSANILYYLGMRADYRGFFQGEELHTVIQMLKESGKDFTEAIRLLKLLDDTELEENINLDLEAEQAEEGHGLEGSVKYYYGKRFERNPKNRKLAIQKHGLDCFVCGFNFEEIYGERGKDFIEVHHINPLSTLGEAIEVNPETDLVPLCANCHRIIHRRKDDILSLESLKNMISKGKR
ncbi:EVE domain-containing protein [Planococcus sp. 1R117A]|uniref:EVE domain-containing protein n=1 Tax=Planococcus sp. 1R117A TaxID=3447020 RepID=UPI003EDBC115